MRIISLIAAVTLAALAGASASDAQAPQETPRKASRACFLANDVSGWKEARPGLMNFRTTRKEYYQATVYGPCPRLDFSQQLVIVSRMSERICEGDDAVLVMARGAGDVGPERCRIDKIRRLSDEEVAALAPKDKP